MKKVQLWTKYATGLAWKTVGHRQVPPHAPLSPPPSPFPRESRVKRVRRHGFVAEFFVYGSTSMSWPLQSTYVRVQYIRKRA